jgi:hypothetical protein
LVHGPIILDSQRDYKMGLAGRLPVIGTADIRRRRGNTPAA